MALPAGRPVLDFRLHVDLWSIDSSAIVVLRNLVCVNMAPAYFTPGIPSSQFALSDRVRAFRRYERQLWVMDTVLVVPSEELSYTRYWLTFLVSPVPEAQAKAAWLKVFDIEISAVNSTGVYYALQATYSAVFQHVRVTDKFGSYPLLPQRMGLTELQAESVPLTAVNRANCTTDFGLALLPNNSIPDDQGRRWVLLLNNISLANGSPWNESISPNATSNVLDPPPLVLPSTTVLGRGPAASAVRLGFARSVNAIGIISGASLSIRQLTLHELAPRSRSYNAGNPLGVLVSPLWAFTMSGGPEKSSLTNCSVVVSSDELRLLQSVLVPDADPSGLAQGTSGRSYSQALGPAVQAFFTAASAPQIAAYGPNFVTVSSGSTPRYRMSGVTFRLPVVADGEAPVGNNFTAMRVPVDGDSGGGGVQGWVIGVIVGCVLGGLLLLGLLGLFLWRRRQPAAEATPYAKYLRGSYGTAGSDAPGRASGGELPPTSSQEITSSSQVLRAGGRESINEGTPGLDQLGSSQQTKGSNGSGTMGAVGHASLSTTGVASREYSGGGYLGASASTSCRALRPPFTAGLAGMPTSLALPSGFEVPADSFEQAPTTTAFGQHAAAGSSQARPGSGQGSSARKALGHGSTPSTQGSGGANGAQSGGLPSATGPVSAATGLEAMHAMIQMLGQGFNDRQLMVHGLLGKGAHGTVYKGTWRGLPVAVKSMVMSNDNNARQQHRPLMEAAISSNLAHPNIVTTYSYELRELEHEFASLSPELARQGGGWRLLIIQEYCDAGPLRRLVDCGFFSVPRPKGGSSSSSRHSPLVESGNGGPVAPSPTPAQLESASGQGGVGSSPGNDGGAGAATPQAEASDGAGPSPPLPQPQRSESLGRPTFANLRSHSQGLGPAAMAEAVLPQPEPEPQPPPQPPPPIRGSIDDMPGDAGARPASPLEAALRFVEAGLQIARGLQHIHDKQIVHGDLNPNNVLLVRTPELSLGFCLKVADFGLSVRMAEGESHLSNLFQGTPYYCAPEVLLSGKIAKSADLYSLGIMLWELQHGQRPPWRRGERLASYPALNTAELAFGAETPTRYTGLTRRCFHASHSNRPSVSEVVETLEGIKAELLASAPQGQA
ncbi:hypothetical protein HYH03_003285 [Edaphochlamys debaryana]|uniref:Protein kinase domain-containing protein n=1 Tax=Edaphochlamys debaryana TaxID=47281 RepID=A0A835YCL1_9CHLO|nr:hypothetical protein HYH03_003285 [Edaphochlamys debaryana]|eukprot:KAG2499102.1 hypothetical protein HYH03_003285 [Edaphochlamys debaryana]